ncbi:MAG TPA: hypothetical protein VF070_09625 [Streptosporangiaceae bacterium]
MVAREIMSELARLSDGPLAGISSLAAGADQVFAFCVLAAGGQLSFVQPADDYRETMSGMALRSYEHLLALTEHVDRLPFSQSSQEAYYAAGQMVVDKCDHLLAVWDGRPAGGLGGTADIVEYAQKQGKPTTVIWPDGSGRA